ncbi:hypothetical protein DM02DRAFT_551907 [Periconia macrospinosa]|uniref:Uncharacterized protein n=1 Tax=Periconia macrospinosa TaxID=97972 RepID=A0A2V1EBF7_9PLEO|nr:hypothetical protein DM02DRAFT_551907 [Periconia macrospinosa]
MPLNSILVASGSPYRHLLPHGIRAFLPYHLSYLHSSRKWYPRSTCFPRRDFHLTSPRASTQNPPSIHNQSQKPLMAPKDDRPRFSRRMLRALRSDRPDMIVHHMNNASRNLYAHSKRSSRLSKKAQNPEHAGHVQHLALPATLYSILSQHVHAVTANPVAQLDPALSDGELRILHSKGYNVKSVEKWSQSILEKHSVLAASLFKDENEIPPLFLVTLFLRRESIRTRSLGIIMKHLQSRIRFQEIPWTSLKILVIRLLRHARKILPEAIPWIASFYTTEAAKIYRHSKIKQVSDMTDFSNTALQLISLPTSVNSLASVTYQEEAQFQVLQFMASCEPALVLTRTGFRAVARNQLAHPKTPQEREWASLKGPGWPPWKENRNAMDEEKGYEFGISRASRIVHKMYEAGYEGGAWEQIVGIYAGWDTDQSPTIQWRTLFPHVSTAVKQRQSVPLTWAARVRATRTRREAWACFLACEASGDGTSAEVYFAMFEKLHHPVAKDHKESRVNTPDSNLPGDAEDVMPDARSPLHYVHLDEPVPDFEALYHRMIAKNVSLTGRLVAFLIRTLPSFPITLQLLEATQSMFDGGLKCLLEGSSPLSNELPVPDYFFASFIKFLCRFGRFSRPPSTEPLPLPVHPVDRSTNHPTEHRLRLERDGDYRVEYALSLLMHYKPAYSPAWVEYAEKIQYYHNFVWGQSKENTAILRAACAVKQYKVLCKIFQTLEEIDHEANDSLFLRLCMTARRATYVAYQGLLPPEDTQLVLSTAPRTVRVAFLNLIGTDVDTGIHDMSQQQYQALTHIPGLPILHLYVRTLSMFRDYEGLYSLSIWITSCHEPIKTLAHTSKRGLEQLFIILVALRSGLEGTWRLDSEVNRASPELVELVKARIESVEGWEWPSTTDVANYESFSRDRNNHRG